MLISGFCCATRSPAEARPSFALRASTLASKVARRTFASLRAVCGDDPVYIARQIGHEDVRRERMTEAERTEYDHAIEWASWASDGGTLGTSAHSAAVVG
jgi:hypothetical protein